MNKRIVIGGILAVQALSAAVFLWNLLSSAFGLRTRPIAWELRELIELGAGAGLLLGVVLGAMALAHADRRLRRAEDRLRVASDAFGELIEERMEQWGLTPAEREVAIFALKGFSTREIAELRNTSEGTVKAQTAAIYRKAGVSSRHQFLSLFVDELLDGALAQRLAARPAAAVEEPALAEAAPDDSARERRAAS